jgi:hypothetical protein
MLTETRCRWQLISRILKFYEAVSSTIEKQFLQRLGSVRTLLFKPLNQGGSQAETQAAAARGAATSSAAHDDSP